jgi:rod shape determining protein RodA
MAAPALGGRKAIASLSRSHADPVGHVDWGLLVTVVALGGFGLVAIYTARFTSITLAGEDPMYFVKRQALALALGTVAMATVMLIDYRRLRDFALFFYVGTSVMLAGLLAVGQIRNGTQAWFQVGPFQLQPSELAKVTLIFLLAAFLANERNPGVPFQRFVGSLVILAIPAGLVMLQPDLGTASVLVACTMGVLLVAGASWKHIALVTLLAVISVGVVYGTGIMDRYQYDRIAAFIDQKPNENNKDIIFQVRNSKAAISQGGITGEGYLKGTMTNGGYVPENHTDFVFSAIGEQFGLVGAGLLLVLYGFLALRIWRIAQMSKDVFGTLICAGALTLLVWHVFENVGMNMGIMPVTGIPLPMISYGGSATVAFLVLMGLVESVHMRRYA